MEMPFGEMDLDLYNIIRDWAIECDTELSINIKSSEHKIHIYTTRPGILIGLRGTLINKYLYALHQHPRWKEYDFIITFFAWRKEDLCHARSTWGVPQMAAALSVRKKSRKTEKFISIGKHAPRSAMTLGPENKSNVLSQERPKRKSCKS